MKHLIVLSGGMDSATVLGLVKRDHPDDVIVAISFQYGQRHEVELASAQAVASYYGIVQVVRPVELGKGGVLMDHNAKMPHQTYDELHEAEGPSPTYVPFRNGTFLSLSASFALEQELDTIWAGMHAEDAHNWAYPDCTPEFIGAMQNAIYVGTYHKVRLCVPFQYASKSYIVQLGTELGVPFELTTSCYEGYPPCLKCPTCIGREEAFRKAGVMDPLVQKVLAHE